MVDPIHVDKLSVTLQARTIISDVSWSAKANQINAIIGPNGAGKSTLLKAISGILPYTGSIRLAGKPLASLSNKERAQQMSWVPQSSQLQIPLTVHDLVAHGRFTHLGPTGTLRQEDHDIIEQSLCDVQSAHLAQRVWTTLSGGEQRRVLIARSLATGAKILLLDEPTASLDIEHSLRVMSLMRDLSERGYTIVPVLHDLNLTKRFTDNILLIANGRPFAWGAAHEVLTDENIHSVYHVSVQPRAAMDFSLGEHP